MGGVSAAVVKLQSSKSSVKEEMRQIFPFLVMVLCFVFDQWTKRVVQLDFPPKVAILKDPASAVSFGSYDITSFLAIRPALNRGISWGWFHSLGEVGRYILVALSVGLIGVLWFLFRKASKLGRFGFAFMIGGALGNVCDRLVDGAVYDFIDIHYRSYHFMIFNAADVFISLGVVIVLIDSFFVKPHQK